MHRSFVKEKSTLLRVGHLSGWVIRPDQAQFALMPHSSGAKVQNCIS